MNHVKGRFLLPWHLGMVEEHGAVANLPPSPHPPIISTIPPPSTPFQAPEESQSTLWITRIQRRGSWGRIEWKDSKPPSGSSREFREKALKLDPA